eukprot:gene14293-14416_t
MRLLLVEDNKELSDWLARLLRKSNYVVDCAYTGDDADYLAASQDYAVLIVDLGLPDMDGMTLIKNIRARKQTTPILILTAIDTVTSRVRGLDCGADDYLVKPFDINELEARIRVQLRRRGGLPSPIITYGDLHFNMTNHIFTLGGQELELTRRESAVLEALISRAGTPLAKSVLIDRVFGLDDEAAPNALEVYVHRVRKKIENANARVTVGLVMDHNLLASARSMAQSIHVVNGVTEAEIPPSAIEMLASPQRDMVYYRLQLPDGLLLAGQSDLGADDRMAESDEPVFADITFRGMVLRSVRLRQWVPLSPMPQFALVIVGQTLGARDKMTNDLWLKGLFQQGALVVAAGLLVWFGLNRGLAPLNQLRAAMNERKIGTLTPLQAPDAPAEVQPLIGSINTYVARLNLLMETQRRFVANAAHQIRTPLTLLKTQATFGLREKTLAGKDEALAGLSASLDHLARLTNQLLILARAEPGINHGARANTDLIPIVQRLMEDFAITALDRSIDFGLELGQPCVEVYGNPTLLRELMANLIDNALRYTTEQSVVTVSLGAVGGEAKFIVQDSGLGIPVSEREKMRPVPALAWPLSKKSLPRMTDASNWMRPKTVVG